MTKKKRGIAHFWQEMKRRNVAKVIVIYASTSFILLQVLDILIKPLFLPLWLMTLAVVVLAIGFPVVIVVSWIFDITPEGIEKTPPEGKEVIEQPAAKTRRRDILYNVIIGILLVIVVVLLFPTIFQKNEKETVPIGVEKSLAVLPFKNESSDTTNVYFINGLMESILTNLQNIKDLRVVSRTSAEKYRNSSKSISEIREELDVSYFIEGSGQKIGDRILLNIQLIDAGQDKHLWAKQFNGGGQDIFEFQTEVAKNVADEIQVVITPEVAARISKAPTEDLVAYDYFLKGLDLLYKRTNESLEASISWFERAIDRDQEFTRAYAATAMAYYYLDTYQTEKKHLAQLNHYAEQAMLLDAQLPQSLIAKALYYMANSDYLRAVDFFEKALEYNPNADLVYPFLVELYANYLPDTEKYLEYALRGNCVPGAHVGPESRY